MEPNEGMQEDSTEEQTPPNQIIEQLMQQAMTISKAGAALKEGGAPAEAADMIVQAGQLLQEGLQALGAGQKQPATMSAPEAGGMSSARPADMRG